MGRASCRGNLSESGFTQKRVSTTRFSRLANLCKRRRDPKRSQKHPPFPSACPVISSHYRYSIRDRDEHHAAGTDLKSGTNLECILMGQYSDLGAHYKIAKYSFEPLERHYSTAGPVASVRIFAFYRRIDRLIIPSDSSRRKPRKPAPASSNSYRYLQ